MTEYVPMGKSYLQYEYFLKYTSIEDNIRCSSVIENHESHLSIERLDYCNDNGIVIQNFLLTPPTSYHYLTNAYFDRTGIRLFKQYSGLFNGVNEDIEIYSPLGSTVLVEAVVQKLEYEVIYLRKKGIVFVFTDMEDRVVIFSTDTKHILQSAKSAISKQQLKWN